VTDATRWEGQRPSTTTNLAVTHEGLRALGVSSKILAALPDAFQEPLRERAPRVLGDTGRNAPAGWEPGLRGDAHLLVLVATKERRDDALDARVAELHGRVRAHGLTIVETQVVERLGKRREHFGWADGLGQPAVEGFPPSGAGEWDAVVKAPGQGVPDPRGGWRDVKAGEFIHGYPDEDAQVVEGPAAPLLRNGSFMVYRKLSQNVARFRRRLRAQALAYGEAVGTDGLDADQLYELMAAKVVGRWRDGVALELAPRRDPHESRRLGGVQREHPDNDFRYGPDPDGLVCPKGAHIRRANPRDEVELSARHRIIRRGMPYGRADDQDRGLVFICFNADFERQFETIQAQWCNDGNAFGLGADTDYLIGSGEGKFAIEGRPPYFAMNDSRLVRTRGCEYLLMPGIEALRDLAEPRPGWGRP